MTKFLNKSFSVGSKPGEKITDEKWEQACGRRNACTPETFWGDCMAFGWFDGGSGNNPGQAAYAWALEYDDKTCVTGMGSLGINTNNVAEYNGLIHLLAYALEHGVRHLKVRGDSQLVLQQAQGLWKVKEATLKPLAARAQELIAKFAHCELIWIPREENTKCDALVKSSIKREKEKLCGNPASKQPTS